jgi:protein translocase SecG subunit
MSIVINILLVFNVLVSLLIILLVLMQRPKNEGLGAAFGGGMTDNLFGSQTTNVLQTITRWLGGIFFALTLTLTWLYVQQSKQAGGGSAVQQKLSAPTVVPPAATPAPTALPETGIAPEAAAPGSELKLEANPPVTPSEPGAASDPAPAPPADAAPAADAAAPAPGTDAPAAPAGSSAPAPSDPAATAPEAPAAPASDTAPAAPPQ